MFGHSKKVTSLSKNRTKRIGQRSITDIINNKVPFHLSRQEKINFIRHRYAYYEGSEKLFFDKYGKSLPLRKELNMLIEDIVDKRISPDALTSFNTYIRAKLLNLKAEELANAKAIFEAQIREQEEARKQKELCERRLKKEQTQKKYDTFLKEYLNDGIQYTVRNTENWWIPATNREKHSDWYHLINEYLTLHPVLNFNLREIAYKKTKRIVTAWAFKHPEIAKKYPNFYNEFSYMFDEEENKIC